ncbi:prolyl oligopeptidase family serine peptidase [Echinimonas agarilytica]|uniref:prolyl oligopeptidase n=1 Tax=Echinimonas agarilytica TaxID=1215918 RepID=A0AA41W7H6_9GAMM|nr:prolyl oligopeptidase family serine peptidase [Echinimonas agarilytica]MCM2679933.1 prolyl oligopeptidase family serine peptidase [Echinimonas agarilytica]
MRKHIFSLMLLSALTACSQTESQPQSQVHQFTQHTPISYPDTRKDDVVDSYFGVEVADPYRWLEDDRSAETAAWVKAENKVTFDYLEQIPYRQALRDKLKTLIDYEKVSAPFKEGDYTYFYKNDGLQNQAVLYRQQNEGPAEIFLDPNTFSEDGTTSLGGLSFSNDGSLVTYLISEGGSDWRKAFVLDAKTKRQLEEPLVDLKFTGIAWKGNEGFYYSSYDKPKGSELSAKTDQHKVYYHALGTPQSEDQLVFGGTDAEKHRYVGAQVTEDDRYLLIYASVSTSGNKLFIKDLQQPNANWATLVGNTESDTELLTSEGERLILITNYNAPNKRIVEVSASAPGQENWFDLIPETNNVLNATKGNGYLFASYMVDAISKVKQFDEQGQLIRTIDLPGIGTASGFDGKADQQTLYYSFTNYKTPTSIFSYNTQTGQSALHAKPEVAFSPNDYVSEQVFYASKDGTQIPMIITYKKGLERNGTTPTILYGYGGFNISLTPRFSATNAAWLELGGIYAVANLRGGGEYGKEWHDAGTQLKKQNVFDDFIAAAEYLIAERYTSPGKLAIRGGSNGGLLVGATMTQRPDLMQVALPAVGVLDMLRYHTFTAGAGWAYDYGTAEDSKDMFNYLLGYSPVQNVKSGEHYPATLITTGDHDDRVVPAHSFKFAAELQDKQAGPNPVMIRIETNAGHGAGTPTSKIIEQYADIFGFTLYNMGVKSL